MPRRPSSWVNLQDYLGLNQEVGQEMGDRVYGDISDQGQKASTNINRASNTFNLRAKQGTLAGPDENAFNSSSNVYKPSDATAKGAQGYTGPGNLSEVDPTLGAQVSDAVQRVQNAQTGYGLGQELQKTYGAQAASGTGGSALDSFLTGATSSEKLSGLKDTYGTLMDSLGLAEQAARARAAKGRADSEKSAKRWQELAPVLEKHAREALIAQAAGERARARQLYEIDLQQEEQYGHGNSYGRGGVAGSTHYIDPREEAAMGFTPGGLTEYDENHPQQPWDYSADYQGEKGPQYGWVGSNRGGPVPYGKERAAEIEEARRRGHLF